MRAHLLILAPLLMAPSQCAGTSGGGGFSGGGGSSSTSNDDTGDSGGADDTGGNTQTGDDFFKSFTVSCSPTGDPHWGGNVWDIRVELHEQAQGVWTMTFHFDDDTGNGDIFGNDTLDETGTVFHDQFDLSVGCDTAHTVHFDYLDFGNLSEFGTYEYTPG